MRDLGGNDHVFVVAPWWGLEGKPMPHAGQGAWWAVSAHCPRRPLLQCEDFLFITKPGGLLEKACSQFSKLPKLVLEKLRASEMGTSPEQKST